MNPEEGDLRPQLLDRFALSVEIHGIRDARDRVQIMERNLLYEADADAFRKSFLPQEEDLSQKIEAARVILDDVTFTKRDLLSIAALTTSLNVDGHRSDLVILKAARAQAAFEGRKVISERDIALAAELALPHRIKRGPFQQMEVTVDELEERISQLEGQVSEETENQQQVETDPSDEGEAQKKSL
jgi:Mg-chelatase subunit ChlI